MISNELLSEVLGLTSGNAFVKEVEIRNSDIEFLCNKGGWTLLNIYELAHKCKEWALKQGYYLHSHTKEYNDCWCIVKSLDNITQQFSCEMDTEVEAIIKACEWILDNKPL